MISMRGKGRNASRAIIFFTIFLMIGYFVFSLFIVNLLTIASKKPLAGVGLNEIMGVTNIYQVFASALLTTIMLFIFFRQMRPQRTV